MITTTSVWTLANEAIMGAVARCRSSGPEQAPPWEIDHLVELSLLCLMADEPATRSVAELHRAIAFYTAWDNLVARLDAAVDKDHLARAGEGRFAIGSRGRALMEERLAGAGVALAAIDPLPADQSRRLADLYRRVADEGVARLVDPWTFAHALRAQIRKDWSPLTQSVRAHLCVATCRSQMHREAWSPADLEPPAMMVVTQVWQGNLSTADQARQVIVGRGFSPEVAEGTLTILRERNVAETDGELRLTPEGEVLRQQVEDETERLFSLVWECLDEGEKDELADLMTRLRDGVTQG